MVDRAGRDPDAARPRADGGRQRAGLSAPGQALRRRTRVLGDGQLRRDRASQRTHARVPARRLRRAPARDPAVRLRPGDDGRGGPHGRGGWSRPRRPELRLPRQEGDEDRRGRDAAGRPGSGGEDRLRDRRCGRHPDQREAAPRASERVARLPRRRPEAGGGGCRLADPAPALGPADVHGRGRPRAHGRARVARRRPRGRLGRHRLPRQGADGARDDGRRRRDGGPRRAGQPVGARGDRRRRCGGSRRARRSSRSSSSSSARPCGSSASAGRAGS